MLMLVQGTGPGAGVEKIEKHRLSEPAGRNAADGWRQLSGQTNQRAGSKTSKCAARLVQNAEGQVPELCGIVEAGLGVKVRNRPGSGKARTGWTGLDWTE